MLNPKNSYFSAL